MRFSLRELLLIVLVVALALGLGRSIYSTHQLFQSSPFMQDAENLEWWSAITSIRGKLNEPSGSVLQQYFFGAPGTASYLHEVCYSFTLTPANEDAFLDALCQDMRAVVSRGKCELRTKNEGSDDGGDGEKSFWIAYRHKGIHGQVRVFLSRKESDTVRLRILFHECRTPTLH